MEERTERFPLYGREEILNRLDQRLDALKKGFRQNIALVGPRFIGKTQILRHLLEKTRADSDIIPIYIPFAPTDFDGFVERWLGGLLQSFLTAHNLPLPEDFQQLVKVSRNYIPKTLERMREAKKHAFQKKTALAFRELLSLTATLQAETGKKIVLMLDEFQCLETLELADPFGHFGKEMMIQKDTLYLVTSSAPHRSREIFSDRLSLLFGNFEIIGVGPLSREGLESFVRERHVRAPIPDFDLRLLRHFLNNHPYYFDLFLEEAESLATRKNFSGWSREFLMEVMEQTLFSAYGLLNRHFEFELQSLSRLGRQPWSYAKILVAISNGRAKLLPIAAYLGKKVSETKKMLQRLVAEGVVEKRGSFFWHPDPLFRFWLRNVYQPKDRDLSPLGEGARSYFRNRLAAEVRKIEEEDRTDVTVRIESLFREFRNDVVEVSQKKIKCPTFMEIAARPTNGRHFPIVSRTSQGRWFCQVFREPVTEGDVASFAEEVKQFRRQFQRKIMVATGGIELNAKLMAQEAKIQVWDLENLNGLFDLYGKLRLIP